MNSIKAGFYEAIIIMLTNGKVLKTAKKSVAIVNDQSLPNTVKHARVIRELKLLGTAFSTTLLDVAVKLALLALRAKVA